MESQIKLLADEMERARTAGDYTQLAEMSQRYNGLVNQLGEMQAGIAAPEEQQLEAMTPEQEAEIAKRKEEQAAEQAALQQQLTEAQNAGDTQLAADLQADLSLRSLHIGNLPFHIPGIV